MDAHSEAERDAPATLLAPTPRLLPDAAALDAHLSVGQEAAYRLLERVTAVALAKDAVVRRSSMLLTAYDAALDAQIPFWRTQLELHRAALLLQIERSAAPSAVATAAPALV